MGKRSMRTHTVLQSLHKYSKYDTSNLFPGTDPGKSASNCRKSISFDFK